MEKIKKRYLITFDEEVDVKILMSKMLTNASIKFKEGVETMASDAIIAEDDVLYFDNLKIVSAVLTMQDVERISRQKGVLFVEENFEAYMLQNKNTDFKSGYKQAHLDIFGALLDNYSNQNFIKSKNQEEQTNDTILGLVFPWNMNMINASSAWNRNINGKGVNVAVLDTGIAIHQNLAIAGGVSMVEGVKSYNDGNGHGTHCAGIIAGLGAVYNGVSMFGVAPACNLYAVKVLADNGEGQLDWIIAGMEWCIQNKMKVVSMSLGSLTDPSKTYSEMVKKCQNKGLSVIVAAGNSYEKAFKWVNAPANSIIDEVETNARPLAVGSVDVNKIIAKDSSRGGKQGMLWNQVSVSAPGVSILSTALNDKYKEDSGTSMACPHVSGLVALLYQKYPEYTPDMIKSKIIKNCLPNTNPNPEAYGSGIIDCDKATQ
jgi:subtilisin